MKGSATAERLLGLFREGAAAVGEMLAGFGDLRRGGTRPGQYALDVEADRIVVGMLHGAGFAVLSEESGLSAPGGGDPGAAAPDGLLVVVDPVDGSTNASRGLPVCATSFCALDAAGPWVALVRDHGTGRCYEAVRGEGAFAGDRRLAATNQDTLGRAFVAVSGLPERHFGWRQYRSLGAAALEICAVAGGAFDAYMDVSLDGLGAWDYMGALLVCREAGAVVEDLTGLDLETRDHAARRHPVAAASPALAGELAKAAEATIAKQIRGELRREVGVRLAAAGLTGDAHERASCERLLGAIETMAEPFDERGAVHVTASGIVTGRRGVVLHRHRKLGTWLQPGGHVDAGETPWGAALRESQEETGIPARHPPGGPVLLHVDEHPGADGHLHLDLRYHLLGADVDPAPPSNESPDVSWLSFDSALDRADSSLRAALLLARAAFDAPSEEPAGGGVRAGEAGRVEVRA